MQLELVAGVPIHFFLRVEFLFWCLQLHVSLFHLGPLNCISDDCVEDVIFWSDELKEYDYSI